ncbi:unnamed protein product [Rhizophagus irregularis]|nr:unnamed protein product [Rhizophagus irregularis]
MGFLTNSIVYDDTELCLQKCLGFKSFNTSGQAPEPTYCDDRQIIPTARRVCYSAFLTATRTSIISVMYTVLARRKYNN